MNIPFITLSVFIVFSSFAFGCTEAWALAACEAVLFTGAALSGLADRRFFSLPRRLMPFALFVAFLAAVCIMQLIPLPASAWKAIDPERVAGYDAGKRAEELLQSELYRKDPLERTEAVKEDTNFTPALPSSLTVSRSPGATFRALLALLAFLCFIFMLEDCARQGGEVLRNLGLVTGMTGLAIGIIALVEKGMEHRTHVMWLRESPRAGNSFGPFVNGNHGEAFINLTFPILCYLIWRKSRNAKKTSDKWGLALVAASFVFLQLALVFSGMSRGNVLAVALIPVAMLFHYGVYKKNRAALAMGAVSMATLVAGGLFLYNQGLLSSPVRQQMNRNVLEDASFLGVGINSFAEVFPARVNEWYTGLPMRNEYLENEYLQLLYEGGYVPFLLAGGMFLLVAFYSFKLVGFKGGRFWLLPPLIAESTRAWVDMSFHIFPIAAAFMVIIALSSTKRGGR